MSPKKLITALTLASALMVVAMPSTVSAQSMEQNQKLEQEIECVVSGYGQSTCKGKQTGEQRQRMLGKTHKVINTGVDTTVLATTSAIAVAGLAAGVLKFKTRA